MGSKKNQLKRFIQVEVDLMYLCCVLYCGKFGSELKLVVWRFSLLTTHLLQ